MTGMLPKEKYGGGCGYKILKDDDIGTLLSHFFQLYGQSRVFLRRVASIEVTSHLVSPIGEGDVFLLGIVDMKDSQTSDQVLHVVDQIQHFMVKRRVVECNEGEIEYLIAFHNNITSIPPKMPACQRIIKKHNANHN